VKWKRILEKVGWLSRMKGGYENDIYESESLFRKNFKEGRRRRRKKKEKKIKYF